MPEGGEEAAALLMEVGERREVAFQQQDHLALGAQLDLIDFETGAAVAGAKCASLTTVPCLTPALVRGRCVVGLEMHGRACWLLLCFLAGCH